jgi:hypothetical protein
MEPSRHSSHLIQSLMLTCIFAASSAAQANSIVPDDIAYKPKPTTTDLSAAEVTVGVAELPANDPSPHLPPTTQYLSNTQCTNQTGHAVNLQKSLAIARFLREAPQSANAGNLFDIETGIPDLIRLQLTEKHQSIGPKVLPLGFAAAQLTEQQLQQQAQKIARQSRTQFILSGTIGDMSMTSPDTTYNPNLYRYAANFFHDATRISLFDKRTRRLALDIQLRDGFTGELLFNKRYSITGIWNQRRPVKFDSPAFRKTPYGKRIKSLIQKISADLAQVIHCQPFMASIDSYPGQTQILLHGGANNGLHAGDTLNLYQVIVVGSNNEYQVADTRLVKRAPLLRLNEVYPSHSIATIEDGSYLNGSYLAVFE